MKALDSTVEMDSRIESRPTLTIIQSTHASLEGLRQCGLLDRHKRLIAEYGKVFHVVLYTCDEADFSAHLGVEHHPVPRLPRSFVLRHLVFYLWLIWRAPGMKGVIKVFGSNIPTLPLVKLLSRLPMMITYQFDYSEQTRKNTLTGLRYWLAPLLERLAISPADLVLVTTGWLEDKIQRVYYKKTVLLPNWVDLGTLQQTCGNKTRNEKMILYAGRLHWSKGVSILLYAFSQVKRRHPEALLVICGEGEQRRSLEELVKSLGTNGVEFRGSLPNDEVLQLMSRAAICVLPTLTMEGHPKVLIEAMACGAACVATDVPGNREVLADGQTGIIVPPSDVEALSNILQLLLSDYSLRDRLGRSAQVEALRYNFSTIVSQEMQVLSALSGAVSGANVG